VTAPRIVKFQDGKLKNGAFGFPRGEKRRIKPWFLMCIHISGNKNTASMPVGIKPGTGTFAEVAYMSRRRTSADVGNSAHDYIARDGSALACIPTDYAAYNNGILLRPNLELDSVKRILRERSDGHNANEAYVREVECTGYPGSFPLTKDQRETVAYLIARDSIKWDLPINRETVHMHRDLDSVNRSSCPFTGDQEAQVGRVIQRARQIKADLRDPQPEPDPEPPTDELEELRDALEAADGRVDELESELADCRATPLDCGAAVNAERARVLDALTAAIADDVAALR